MAEQPNEAAGGDGEGSRRFGMRFVVVLLIGVLLLSILYVLSVGPVIALLMRIWSNPNDAPEWVVTAANAFYFPLIWVSQQWPAFEDVMSGYMQWWGVS